MGIEIDPEYVAQLQRTVDEQAKKKREKRLERENPCPTDWSERYPYAEGDMYFVAGHTSNGVPYGLTWEEAREQRLIEYYEPGDPPDTTDRKP